MAVAFDAVGPSAAGTGSGTNSLSWTHTPVGSGVVIVAGVGEGHVAGADGTVTVTCGGVSMTQLGAIPNNNSNGGRTLLFGIANQTGAKTIAVTRTGGAAITTLVGGSVSYTGADTANPFGAAVTAFGSTGAESVTVPGTTAGNMVAGFTSVGSTSLSGAMTAGTKRWFNDFDTTSAAGIASQADAAAGGSVALTWASNGDWWGAIGVEVKVPSAGGTGILPRQMRIRRPAIFYRLAKRGHGARYGR